MFGKKGVIRKFANSQKNTCARVSFLTKFIINFIKKETLAKVISYVFCEISKNTFSYKTPPVAASGSHYRFYIYQEYSPGFKLTPSWYCAKFWWWHHHYGADVIIVILMASGKNMKNFKYCALSLNMLHTGELCGILGFTTPP